MKTCPEHNKPFSPKSPNKGGFYWHVINFEKDEYCSKSKEEYNALPDENETTPETKEFKKDQQSSIEFQSSVKAATAIVRDMCTAGILDVTKLNSITYVDKILGVAKYIRDNQTPTQKEGE